MTAPEVARALDGALVEILGLEAPLADRLQRYAVTLRALNRPFAEAVDRLIARLRTVGAGQSAPQIGETLPEFLLPGDDGHLVSLTRLLEGGPIVVAFRRGHWCPYCRIATDALARVEKTSVAMQTRVVVISPERETYTRRLKAVTSARFPILSDIDNGYALSVGLAISVGEEMRQVMTVRGRDLAAYHGNHAWLLPIPATFVLDARGTIRMRHVDPDYRVRAPIEDIIASLQSLHGAP